MQLLPPGFRISSGGVRLPAGPAAITDWSVATGDADGQLKITITTNPAAGDGSVVDDGLGSITGYEWRPAEGDFAWMSFGAGSPGTFAVSGPLIPGETLAIEVRARGHAGRRGARATSSPATVAGEPMVLLRLYSSADEPLYTEDGKHLAVLIPAD